MKTGGEKDLKLGLALSGGGFRATAYHLGVLKRLHELEVLERIDVVSTVSGGSIAGAFWVWWRAIGHPAASDADVWDEFERRLVRLMRANLRGRIMFFGAVLPAIACLLALAAGLLLFDVPIAQPSGLALIAGGALAGAYLGWTQLSGSLLVHYYDRFLFEGAHLTELAAVRREKKSALPQLFVNATALESAQQVMFTEKERMGEVFLGMGHRVPVVNLFTGAIDLFRSMAEKDRPPGKARRTLWRSEAFARAVAASSAVPGVFPPVTVGGAFDSFSAAMRHRFPERFSGAKTAKPPVGGDRYLAVDGGVFDNQGIEALIEQSCTGIIVSDAAAQLLPASGLSMWRQVSLLKRSQDIIYSRVRQLGYAQLGLLRQVDRLMGELSEAGLSSQKLTALRKKGSPPVTAYCAVELAAAKRVGKPLPRALRPLVAAVRTDLDAFSAPELSALMYHGYIAIDHELKQQKVFLSKKAKQPRFETKLADLNLEWSEVKQGDLARAKNHLRVSSGRFATWRAVRRAVGTTVIWLSEQPWMMSALGEAVEAWRQISPTWKRVETMRITKTSADGETRETVEYGWRRRHLIKSLWRWIKEATSREVAEGSEDRRKS